MGHELLYLVLYVKGQIQDRDPEKELKEAFAVFDTDGSGAIDRKELKRLMKRLGQNFTEQELDAMMEEGMTLNICASEFCG